MRMTEVVDRQQLKREMKDLLRSAQVSPKAMMALYMLLVLALNLADVFAGGGAAGVVGGNLLGTFVSVLTSLLSLVLATGFTLYCMAVRRREEAPFLTLFDGFSFVGKIIGLYIVEYFFICLWTMLFIIPGFVAAYRYRFAIYNLCEHPELGVMEALEMSKQQTLGYKSQLLMLDLSYLGWFILASLPVGYEGFYIWLGQSVPLPSAVITIIAGLWGLAVYLFFLPVYQCTELGYFETAKRTSGVSISEEPPEEPFGF